MSENYIIPLQIMLLGISLVFIAMIILWVVMVLIVRFTANTEEESDQLIIISSNEPDEHKFREMAAAATFAVLYAQQMDKTQPHPFPLPPTPLVSAWQAVLRSRMLTRRGMKR